jgi:hypothetical protein
MAVCDRLPVAVSSKFLQVRERDAGHGAGTYMDRHPTPEATAGRRSVSPMLSDGLYQVTTSSLCAGFVVEGGKVTLCAPILRRKLSYWMTLARRIAS